MSMTKNEDKQVNVTDTIHKELQIISNLQPSNIIDIKSTNWNTAIPVYDVNRYNAINKLRSLFLNKSKGLVLFGNYVDGISIREIISHAKSFSNQSNL